MFLRFSHKKRELLGRARRTRCLWFKALGLTWPVLAWLGHLPAQAAEPAVYRREAQVFAADMAVKNGFDRAAVAKLLARARYRQDIVDAMRRPHEGKPWSLYRPIFLTQARIEGGLAFWQTHADLLERAEREYGVPAEVIVAIIGVETGYGGNLGRHKVIDALTTLGFAYPPRAEFFRGELESFLLLAREEAIDAGTAKGSYAGALGKPQFIPSSYRAFAVDFDGDGRRDLWRSDADVIGSVANFLRLHGWRPGEPVASPAVLTPEAHAAVGTASIPTARKEPVSPSMPVAELSRRGVAATEAMDPAAPAALLALDGPEDEFWIAFNNFYVITRYNRSNLYAMAVHQLGREIKALYLATESRQAAANKGGAG